MNNDIEQYFKLQDTYFNILNDVLVSAYREATGYEYIWCDIYRMAISKDNYFFVYCKISSYRDFDFTYGMQCIEMPYDILLNTESQQKCKEQLQQQYQISQERKKQKEKEKREATYLKLKEEFENDK
jgi:hypothetical protein